MARLDDKGLGKLWEFVQKRTPVVVQTTGGSERAVMSQKAVTEAIGAPVDYVVAEAEKVISRVVAAQGTRTFNLAIITDLHNNGGASDAQVLHACQGVGHIADRVKLDAFACLGDHTDSAGATDWAECLADILACNNRKHTVRNTPMLELIGNHDFKSVRDPMTCKTISAFSTDVEWGDMLGGYFRKDIAAYKLRIICLNTSETANVGVSAAQKQWFVDTLDLSEKSDAAEWQTLILSHVPLDWAGLEPFTHILQAYLNGVAWTDGTISCNYTGKNQATLIACVHGHIHNLLVDKLYLGDATTSTEQIDLYRIAIPEITEAYGNHYGSPYAEDMRYPKTANTAQDTSFNVLCIDLDAHKIKAICYGAGYDRAINYDVFDSAGDNPTYTNWIPRSVNADGTDYIGHNGEDGYSAGYRINSSGVESAQAGMCCMGFIPYAGETIYLKNATISGTKSPYLVQYQQDKSYRQVLALDTVLTDDGNGVLTGSIASFQGWIRITCGLIDATTVLTLDEPIN